MAVWFGAASSQGIAITAFPLSTFPLSFGGWVYFPALPAANNCILTVSTAAASNYATIFLSSAGVVTIEKTGGVDVTVATIPAGEWFYLLVRVISATSVRCSVLNGRTGVISHANHTGAGAMTGFDTFSVGDLRLTSTIAVFMTGGVGELFICGNDCYSSGGQTADNSFIKKLAWDGPLSVPRIRDQLIDYRSFRSSPVGGHGDEILAGYRGLQNWANNNGAVNGPHPPLPPGYAKVRPTRQLLVV